MLVHLVLSVPFSALTLIVVWQEGYQSRKKAHSTYSQRFFSRTGGVRPFNSQLTEVYPEKWSLNG